MKLEMSTFLDTCLLSAVHLAKMFLHLLHIHDLFINFALANQASDDNLMITETLRFT